MSPFTVMLSTVSAPVTLRSDPSQVRLSSVSVPPLESVIRTRFAVKPDTCRFLMIVEPVPFGVILISPFVSVDDIVLPSIFILSISRSPVMSTPPVTPIAEPSHVKFASSSREPAVPATTILLSVRSLTDIVEATTSPVPFGVRSISPFVSVEVIALPLMLMLSTSRSPVTSMPPVTATFVPSNVRFALSVSEPLAPAYVMRVAVRSLTVALASVASPVTFSVPPVIVPLAVTLTAPVSEPLAREAVPSVTVPPSIVPEAVTPPVTSSSEPLNVMLALSVSAPLAPANVTRVAVRSLTDIVDATTSPVPFGVKLISPFVSVEVIALPSIVMLSIAIDSSSILDAFIPAYEEIVTSPAVVPSSVVLIATNMSALSSHTNATFVDVPRSTTNPLSALGVPDSPLLKTNRGSAINVFVVSTVVVVPLTVRFPLIVKLLLYVRSSSSKPAVIVLLTNFAPVMVLSVI